MRTFFVPILMFAGCSATTGGGLVSFTARAGGPQDVSGPVEFDAPSGYHLTLSTATFHVGAVYLNMSPPPSGGPEEPCMLPGIYVGQAFGACDGGRCGVDFDLLSSEMVTFPLAGHGTASRALAGEVWLSGVEGASGGDINAVDDPTPILQVSGVATRNTVEWPFSATVTIGKNRQIPPQNVAMPGTNPSCRQRIVSPIPIPGGLVLTDGGTLDLRVDPRKMFNNVDFAALPITTGTYVIPDEASGPDDPLGVGNKFFRNGVLSNSAYQFTFTNKQ